ncbi:MAG TPA: hypothetical protein PK014_06900 [Thermoanaerobaculia bacterium]|nr:hypothetical protein [Thermoanaerobaculia bacterium]HUM29832.1 hypothetical protein [Thermoanaerobaculia bacterium]HXK68107.1 hypothetical protein [Thermoanaerobaculia bacterium]
MSRFLFLLVCISSFLYADTPVMGPVSGTWTAGESPYILEGDTSVPSGETLTMEPGTVVRSNGSYSLTIYGQLITQASGATGVTLTSNAPSPAKGDWVGIILEDGAILTGDHLSISYAEYGIHILQNSPTASLTLTDSTLSQNDSGLDLSSGTAVVTSSLFENNDYGFYAGSMSPGEIFLTISSSTFTDQTYNPGGLDTTVHATFLGNSATGSPVNGFLIFSADWPADLEWTSTGIPFVNDGGDFTIPPERSLTLGNGTIMKTRTYNDGFDTHGSLIVQGSLMLQSGTRLTSLKDDTGGDTNGDGSTSSPAPGDWIGIVHESSASGITVSGSNISYASHAIEIKDGASSAVVMVSDTTFSYNSSGLSAAGGMVSVLSCSFISNDYGFTAGTMSPGEVTLSVSSSTFTNQTYFPGGLDTTVHATLTDNSASGSPNNGFAIFSADWPSDLSWVSTGVPLVNDGGDFTIPFGRSLTLKSGTILKTRKYNDGFDTHGSLTVEGSLVLQSGTRLTSLKDDTGGDTNGDGSASLPARGDWIGIILENSATAMSATGTAIAYADHGIQIRETAPDTILTLTGSNLAYNGSGISVGGGSASIVSTSFLSNNYGFTAGTMSPGEVTLSVSSSTFTDQTYFPGGLDTTVQATLTDNSASGSPVNGFVIFSADWPADLEWISTGVPFVNDGGDFTIPSGRTFTLGSNTIVKSRTYDDGLNVYGSFKVEGSMVLQSGTLLTSLMDDTGGDTNGDGSASLPASGDWIGVVLENSATGFSAMGSQLSYADYGVQIRDTAPTSLVSLTGSTLSHHRTGLRLSGGTALVESCIFDTNDYGFTAGAMAPQQVNLFVTSSTFTDHTYFPGGLDSSAQATLQGNFASGSPINGFVIFSADWSSNLQWTSTGVPFVNDGGDFTIPPGHSLTLKEGTIVKTRKYVDTFTTYGSFQVLGTLILEPNTHLTSLPDDIGGDTNGDGSSSLPSPGDWVGIVVSGGSVFSNSSRINFTETALNVGNSGSGTITGTFISYNGTGVQVDTLSTLDLGNLGNPDPLDDGTNQIFCNQSMNLINLHPASTVMAENNFWSPLPPIAIDGFVDYDPYLSDAPPGGVAGLLLEKASESDLGLSWSGPSGMCTYLVKTSLTPGGSFQDISGPLNSPTYIDYGALDNLTSVYYRVFPQ